MSEDEPVEIPLYKQILRSTKAQVWRTRPMTEFEMRDGKKYRVEKNGELRRVYEPYPPVGDC